MGCVYFWNMTVWTIEGQVETHKSTCLSPLIRDLQES